MAKAKKKEKKTEALEKEIEKETITPEVMEETNTALNEKEHNPYHLRPYQQECIDILDKTPTGHHIVSLATGLGKCFATGTKVLMADGSIKKIEEIKEKEEVMGPDGKPRIVIGLTHGFDEMYTIHQNKGIDYTVNSVHILSLKMTNANHNVLDCHGNKYSAGDVVNIPIKDYLKSSKNFKHCAKGWKPDELQFDSQETRIDPYLLGIWLGGGTSWHSNSFNEALSFYNLINNKHIPKEFLFNSIDVRYAVLAGLLDSDGHLVDNIVCEITTKSPQLKEDIEFLVRSLGFYVSCSNKVVNDKQYYRLHISGHTGKIPCKVKRKQALPREQKKDALCTEITVEPVGYGEYYGFELIGPDRLFLLADFTVVHNTYIFSHIKRNGRTLILSHRDELVRQPQKYYEGQCSFGIEKGGEYSNGEDVVSASVQSLCKENRLKRFKPDDFDTIICDEAHHMAAQNKSYMNILNYFTGAKRLLGFTATVKRGDNVRLDNVFDDILFNRDTKWGIKNKYLSNLRCEMVQGHYSLKGVKKDNFGDFSQKDLNTLFDNNDKILPTAARAYVEKCRDKHTLIYCTNTDICNRLYETICKLLPREEHKTIAVLTGKNTAEERKAILDGYVKGDIKTIINCMILTEGTDLPMTDCIMNLRLTCNPSLFQQIVGRGLRLYEGKKYCLVIDIVPDDMTNSRSLCTAPTLFGIDPSKLSNNQRQAMAEKDLLELCEDWSDELANQAKHLKLETEEVDLFVEEYENFRRSSPTLQDLANNWEKKREENQTDIDFKNLKVQIQASETKRYKIQPDWDNVIYISQPDILNEVTFTYNNDSQKMKLDEAISLAQRICESTDRKYRHSWDKNAQKEWENAEATANQKGALYHLYKEPMKDWTMPENRIMKEFYNDNNLSKMMASELIDYAKTYEDMCKKKKTLDRVNSDKKDKATKEAKEQYEYEYQQKQKQKKNTLLKDLEKELNRREKEKENAANKILNMDEIVIIKNNFIPSEFAYATIKQISYFQSLQRAVKDRYVLPEKINQEINGNLSGRQITLLIDLFKKIDQIIPQGYTLEIHNLANVLEEADYTMEWGSKHCFAITVLKNAL